MNIVFDSGTVLSVTSSTPMPVSVPPEATFDHLSVSRNIDQPDNIDCVVSFTDLPVLSEVELILEGSSIQISLLFGSILQEKRPTDNCSFIDVSDHWKIREPLVES